MERRQSQQNTAPYTEERRVSYVTPLQLCKTGVLLRYTAREYVERGSLTVTPLRKSWSGDTLSITPLHATLSSVHLNQHRSPASKQCSASPQHRSSNHEQCFAHRITGRVGLAQRPPPHVGRGAARVHARVSAAEPTSRAPRQSFSYRFRHLEPPRHEAPMPPHLARPRGVPRGLPRSCAALSPLSLSCGTHITAHWGPASGCML